LAGATLGSRVSVCTGRKKARLQRGSCGFGAGGHWPPRRSLIWPLLEAFGDRVIQPRALSGGRRLNPRRAWRSQPQTRTEGHIGGKLRIGPHRGGNASSSPFSICRSIFLFLCTPYGSVDGVGRAKIGFAAWRVVVCITRWLSPEIVTVLVLVTTTERLVTF